MESAYCSIDVKLLLFLSSCPLKFQQTVCSLYLIYNSNCSSIANSAVWCWKVQNDLWLRTIVSDHLQWVQLHVDNGIQYSTEKLLWPPYCFTNSNFACSPIWRGARSKANVFVNILLAFASKSIKYYFLTIFISKYLRDPLKLSAKYIDLVSFENTRHHSFLNGYS